MKKMYHFKGSLQLMLISAILILCIGFFIVSCGNKPQQKTLNTDYNSYGVDLGACPIPPCVAYPAGSENYPIPSIGGRSLTIEAWVKNRVTSTSGAIFGRFSGNGAGLYVKNGIPKFGIGRAPILADPVTGCTVKGTSTECVLSSEVRPDANTWTHVAGVLANEAHSHTLTATCTNAVMLETPHMDIYINGVFENCSSTGSQFADNPGGNQMTIGSVGALDSVDNTNFDATIDEIRFWNYARTASQINECKSTELGIGGACDRGDSGLIAYYRLNEGKGSDVTDSSGNGFNGSFEYVVGLGEFEYWDDGWVLRTDALTPARAD